MFSLKLKSILHPEQKRSGVFFINPEHFLKETETLSSSEAVDADAELSSVENDALHFNYAHIDYISSYTATLPRRDPSALMTKIFHDPLQSYVLIGHLQWNFSQKNKPVENCLAQCFIDLFWKSKRISKN